MPVQNIDALYRQYREYVYGLAGFVGIFAAAGIAFFLSFYLPITILEWGGVISRSSTGAIQDVFGDKLGGVVMGVMVLCMIVGWLFFFIALFGLTVPVTLCGTVYLWARWHARAGTPLELLQATIDYALKRAGKDGVPESIQERAKLLEKIGWIGRLNLRHLQWQGRLCSMAIAAAYRPPQP
jgi:hypothetical protein